MSLTVNLDQNIKLKNLQNTVLKFIFTVETQSTLDSPWSLWLDGWIDDAPSHHEVEVDTGEIEDDHGNTNSLIYKYKNVYLLNLFCYSRLLDLHYIYFTNFIKVSLFFLKVDF